MASSLKVCCPNKQTAHADLRNNLIPGVKCPGAKKKTMWCFLAQAELLPCDTGPVLTVGVWRSGQAVTPGTPCVQWPGSVGDFHGGAQRDLTGFELSDRHLGALFSVLLPTLPQVPGVLQLLFARPRSLRCCFTCRMGGIPAVNGKGERLLLHVGIIDILQSYR